MTPYLSTIISCVYFNSTFQQQCNNLEGRKCDSWLDTILHKQCFPQFIHQHHPSAIIMAMVILGKDCHESNCLHVKWASHVAKTSWTGGIGVVLPYFPLKYSTGVVINMRDDHFGWIVWFPRIVLRPEEDLICLANPKSTKPRKNSKILLQFSSSIPVMIANWET